MGTMNTVLKVEHLKKYFPVKKGLLRRGYDFVRAVDDIQFEIHEGETLGLVGESGSGKSTTGRCILRLIDPTGGRIWFKGQEITDMSRKALRPLRQSMQIIFQDPYSSLNPRMTVKEIIGEGLWSNRDLSAREKKERILETMDRVALRPEHYDRHPHEFSGGQRQRIGIARAVILNPEMIVADEPLSALDVSIQAQVINLLERLQEEFGFSYLFISHDLSVVEHISTRIAVMYLGKIVELASKEELYNNPKHPYTVSLLSAVPVPKVQKKRGRIILKGDIPSPLQLPKGCNFHTRCPRRIKICSEVAPEWRDLGNGHYAACHLY